MKQPPHVVVVALLTGVQIGCASITSAGAGSKREPRTLELRNDTDQTLTRVRIRAVGDSGVSNRLGQVSPVLARVAYTFARSPRAPALPSQVQLTWSDAAGREHSAIVGIADLLVQATGAEDETLGFVILPDGTAFAQLSSTTPP